MIQKRQYIDTPKSCIVAPLQSISDLCDLLKLAVDAKPSHLLIVGDLNFNDIDWANNIINSADPCTLMYHEIP